MHFSAKRGLAIACRLSVPYNLYCVGGDVKSCSINQSICPSVCLSVCDVGGLWSHM